MEKELFNLIDNLNELILEKKQPADENELICECFCVTVRMIREVCPEELNLELLSRKLNLGNGCKSCLRNINEWNDRIFF